MKKNIVRIALATTGLLLLPLLAMQFTDEVVWDRADFALAGVLLFGAGLTYELLASKSGHFVYRAAVGVAVLAVLLLLWMNLAVGIIGNEGNAANLMYIGVLAVGIIGALVARFHPQGMGRAMFATALAQILVGVIALTAGLGTDGPAWPKDIWSATGFFAALWLASALLFHRASAVHSR